MSHQDSLRFYGWVLLGAGLFAYVFRVIIEVARSIPGGAYPYWLFGAPWASFAVGILLFFIVFILLASADWRRSVPSSTKNTWKYAAIQIAIGLGFIVVTVQLYAADPRSARYNVAEIVTALLFLLPVYGVGALFLHAGIRNIFRACRN